VVLRVRDETFGQSVKTDDPSLYFALHKHLSMLIKLAAAELKNGK
jgi:hypothetical protein